MSKILLSAYACEPDKGSEPEVGLRALMIAAERHHVWLITRQNNVAPLAAYLSGSSLGRRIELVGVDVDGLPLQVKNSNLVTLHLYYDLWQRRVSAVAQDLDRRVNFDLVHHVTFASYYSRVGVASVDKPLVWGPVGGGVSTPAPLRSVLGWKGRISDIARRVLHTTQRTTVGMGRAGAERVVALAQNNETLRRLPSDVAARVLPNATAVEIGTRDYALGGEARRTKEIALIGRLVPLKAGVLAIRALAYAKEGEARLHVYGDGPERPRMDRLARSLGVRDRVVFEGWTPRRVLLQKLATSAALLHPSLHEEAGMAVAEALSLGTPVVALDHGGPRELVALWSDSPATLVPTTTPGDTARALALALDGYLQNTEPAFVEPLRSTVGFERGLLEAYDQALSLHHGRRG